MIRTQTTLGERDSFGTVENPLKDIFKTSLISCGFRVSPFSLECMLRRSRPRSGGG